MLVARKHSNWQSPLRNVKPHGSDINGIQPRIHRTKNDWINLYNKTWPKHRRVWSPGGGFTFDFECAAAQMKSIHKLLERSKIPYQNPKASSIPRPKMRIPKIMAPEEDITRDTRNERMSAALSMEGDKCENEQMYNEGKAELEDTAGFPSNWTKYLGIRFLFQTTRRQKTIIDYPGSPLRNVHSGGEGRLVRTWQNNSQTPITMYSRSALIQNKYADRNGKRTRFSLHPLTNKAPLNLIKPRDLDTRFLRQGWQSQSMQAASKASSISTSDVHSISPPRQIFSVSTRPSNVDTTSGPELPSHIRSSNRSTMTSKVVRRSQWSQPTNTAEKQGGTFVEYAESSSGATELNRTELHDSPNVTSPAGESTDAPWSDKHYTQRSKIGPRRLYGTTSRHSRKYGLRRAIILHNGNKRHSRPKKSLSELQDLKIIPRLLKSPSIAILPEGPRVQLKEVGIQPVTAGLRVVKGGVRNPSHYVFKDKLTPTSRQLIFRKRKQPRRSKKKTEKLTAIRKPERQQENRVLVDAPRYQMPVINEEVTCVAEPRSSQMIKTSVSQASITQIRAPECTSITTSDSRGDSSAANREPKRRYRPKIYAEGPLLLKITPKTIPDSKTAPYTHVGGQKRT